MDTRTTLRRVALLAWLLVCGPGMPTGAASHGIDRATLADRLAGLANAPSRRVLDAALTAYDLATQRGQAPRADLLTVIDYTRPSTEPRLWVLDLSAGRILYHELVAHGRGSGDNTTRAFSNVSGSLMSSRGLFVTDTSYIGRNGYSLRLLGLEPGINDHARARAIVVHGAPYVSRIVADRLGRLGRSWGCPAVRMDVARALIDTIKGGTLFYAYGEPAA